MLIFITHKGEGRPSTDHLIRQEPIEVDVNRLIILAAHQNLRYLVSLTPTYDGTRLLLFKQALFSETEVREASMAALVNQHILRLDVPVHDSVPMKLLNG